MGRAACCSLFDFPAWWLLLLVAGDRVVVLAGSSTGVEVRRSIGRLSDSSLRCIFPGES